MSARRLGLAILLAGCVATPCPTSDAARDDDAGLSDAGPDTGPPVIAITLTPPMLALGGCGETTAPIHVTNVGTVPTGPLVVSWRTGTVGFRTVDDACRGGLPVGGDCVVTIEHEALTPAEGTLEVRASGVVATAALIADHVFDCGGFAFVAPTPFSFDPTPVGATAAHVFTARFTGVPVDVLSVSISGRDAPQFVIAADGCTGARIGAVVTCTVDVAFVPTAPGDYLASLSVVAGGTANAALVGTGL